MFTTNLKKAVFGSIVLAIAASAFANSASAAEKEIIGFRLKKWKTIHFEDMKKAAFHLKLTGPLCSNGHSGPSFIERFSARALSRSRAP